jgi:hypothetical protein
MAHDKNMRKVTYPSDFILETIMNKFNTCCFNIKGGPNICCYENPNQSCFLC